MESSYLDYNLLNHDFSSDYFEASYFEAEYQELMDQENLENSFYWMEVNAFIVPFQLHPLVLHEIDFSFIDDHIIHQEASYEYLHHLLQDG